MVLRQAAVVFQVPVRSLSAQTGAGLAPYLEVGLACQACTQCAVFSKNAHMMSGGGTSVFILVSDSESVPSQEEQHKSLCCRSGLWEALVLMIATFVLSVNEYQLICQAVLSTRCHYTYPLQ